jgi:hypothetical protein
VEPSRSRIRGLVLRCGGATRYGRRGGAFQLGGIDFEGGPAIATVSTPAASAHFFAVVVGAGIGGEGIISEALRTDHVVSVVRGSSAKHFGQIMWPSAL